jgi:hypothetical protein
MVDVPSGAVMFLEIHGKEKVVGAPSGSQPWMSSIAGALVALSGCVLLVFMAGAQKRKQTNQIDGIDFFTDQGVTGRQRYGYTDQTTADSMREPLVKAPGTAESESDKEYMAELLEAGAEKEYMEAGAVRSISSGSGIPVDDEDLMQWHSLKQIEIATRKHCENLPLFSSSFNSKA